MTDVLEQSLIDLGLCFNEYYDRYVQSGLTARSYTKQKYRKKYYSWLQVGKELKEQNLVKDDISLDKFSEECFRLGLNEYLKKLYYYSTDFR